MFTVLREEHECFGVSKRQDVDDLEYAGLGNEVRANDLMEGEDFRQPVSSPQKVFQ